MAQRKVVLYSKASCGLCDEARELILAERGRAGFDFEEVLIDGDRGLEDEYALRVPVVAVDGVPEFETEVEPTRFRRLVSSAG